MIVHVLPCRGQRWGGTHGTCAACRGAELRRDPDMSRGAGARLGDSDCTTVPSQRRGSHRTSRRSLVGE